MSTRNRDKDPIGKFLDDIIPEDELARMFEGSSEERFLDFLEDANKQFDVNQIVEGKIVEINEEFVVVDVGFKSEGAIPKNEWEEGEEPPQVGQMIKVLIEEVEDQNLLEEARNMIVLSKRKAEKIIQWEKMMASVQEGQVFTGTVTRKIKGGLLVDIGVNVFLPASQVDIRRPNDIGDYIGRVVQCEVLKIDEARRNIVVSRRSLIEKQREEDRERLMAELEIGQIRKGVVKNIADFGAFVDLGGIDGLLHITDMSWERIGHPTEMVAIDQEIEVKILQIDREKQKIALGLKQKQNNPWTNIAEKFPVGSTVPGEVVNVMSYGAFVKLEPGIEGLVHISEMSWTRRINHPSEMVQIGDKIDVRILGVDPQGQQLSLGIKQTQANPWDDILQRYPENAEVAGKVRHLTNYGAFIELEEGIDGLLQVSDMSWTRKIMHPSEVLQEGQHVKCRVLSVDQNRRRIMLGMKQLEVHSLDSFESSKYERGQLISGRVARIDDVAIYIATDDSFECIIPRDEQKSLDVEMQVGMSAKAVAIEVDLVEKKIVSKLVAIQETDDEEPLPILASFLDAVESMIRTAKEINKRVCLLSQNINRPSE